MNQSEIKSKCLKISDLKSDVKNIADSLHSKDASLNILFVSNNCDYDELSLQCREFFGNNLIACSTAGEIAPKGYATETITGMAFHGDEFISDTIVIDNLQDIHINNLESVKLQFETFQKQFNLIKEKHQRLLPNSQMFGLLLIDGLSIREELITSIIANSIGNTPLIGGSAADGLDFTKTKVFHNGEFHNNIATLTFISTTRPFEIFKNQHFTGSEQKIIITDSDPEQRIVKEIDGMPAAEAYAKHLGMEIKDFTPETFSKHPLMLKVANDWYVRSIQKVNPDQSITFYCAIDNGLVLTIANRENIVTNTQELFRNLNKKIGPIDNCLLFECILRQIETNGLPHKEKKSLINTYQKNNTIGFHTYGEQFGGLHINQTITGVAFGRSKDSAA